MRAAVLPDLKRQVDEIASKDLRVRSTSQLIEAALGYWLRDYLRAGGMLDGSNFPILPPEGAGPLRPPKPREGGGDMKPRAAMR